MYSVGRDLLKRAACAEADPRLFDATHYETAWQALAYCYDCPVVQQCYDVIRPERSYYDGVAAGRVWRNGLRVLIDGKVIGRRSRRNLDELIQYPLFTEVTA